ncbi:DnaJ domain-containing protein [Actinokineospora sp. HUAS TT18]|uniref:DnaJ domain-containing protein n=1 Tax=Actinokineospora sp. HUAS TT18 TaxID=3447451 RepID=UPI003F522A1F
MSTDQPDPYTVLGLPPGACPAEITAAYRHAVRTSHPDTPHPDRERLAAVIAAYHQLRGRDRQQPTRQQHPDHGHDIPVRIHPDATAPSTPDLRAGPVRRHPRRS